MRVLRFATIDSTNLEAARLVAAGEAGPLWIVAGAQEAGKGRLGRNWVSMPGNLYATLLWPTGASPAVVSQISFVAAVAVHETSCAFADQARISLKWPNDCLLDGAKFCGILAEVLAPGRIAIGIGINLAHVPDGLPYQAAKLEGAGVDAVFERLSLSLSNWLEIWDEGRGFAAIRQAWQARCHHLGARISVDGEAGTFAGLAEDGALLLQKPDGTQHPIYAGDTRVEYQPRP